MHIYPEQRILFDKRVRERVTYRKQKPEECQGWMPRDTKARRVPPQSVEMSSLLTSDFQLP